MMKRVPTLWSVCLILSSLFSSTQDQEFSLILRIIQNTQKTVALHRDDLELQINGIPRTITRLHKQERSLSRVPDLGRHFILSLHDTRVTKPIENAISYFFTEILTPWDSLILLSSGKAFRIPVTKDKEKTIMDVIDFLSREGRSYEKSRISAEKNLEAQLQRLNSITSSRMNDLFTGEIATSEQALTQATNLASNYKAINQILLNFPPNFNRFKNRYLLPDIVKHKEVKDLFEKKRGEKWWIHFQPRKDIQIIHKARSAGRKLNAYITATEYGTLAQTMQKSLADLEKQLLISEFIPQAEILESLLGENICYNIVFWGSIETDETDISIKETAGLEAVLSRIAEFSGGKALVTTDPEQGLKEIKNHTDLFYALDCEWDGSIEEQKIQISTGQPNLKLSYKQKFSEAEMAEWLQTLTEEKIAIRDFLLDEKTIHFKIESFERNTREQFGIIKVRISLFDSNGTNVYHSENTLRASKDKVVISVPIPPEHKGDFRLMIQVFDLIANTAASSEHSIVLSQDHPARPTEDL